MNNRCTVQDCAAAQQHRILRNTQGTAISEDNPGIHPGVHRLILCTDLQTAAGSRDQRVHSQFSVDGRREAQLAVDPDPIQRSGELVIHLDSDSIGNQDSTPRFRNLPIAPCGPRRPATFCNGDVSGLNLRDKIKSCIVLPLKNRIVRVGDVFDGVVGMHSRHHFKTWLVMSLSGIDSPRIIQMQGFR